LYTFFVAAAGLMLASCKQEHIEVVYNPDATTVQTLGNFSETVLTDGGADLVATFTPADFKIDAAKSYALYTSSAADMSDKSKMAAKISVNEDESAGQITLSQKDLNSKILSLGGEADVPFTLYFQLGASIANDKGNAIASTEVLSNIASVKLTPYNTLILDVDSYDHVWIIGASSAVGAWSFEKVHQYLYDYEKTGTTFTGLIDFGEDGPAGGFKLTGVGNWDDATKNWGSEAQAEEAEAATVQIIAGGSSKDIKCYSKRYYGFSFNSSTLVLTKLYGFDNIGIVGAFNKWNAGDANMKMSYNQDFHRFYIDYTFAEATELKFACDDSWDLNWGGKEGTTAPNGDNIAVEPGSYRIYLDINKGTYELSTSMFGKDEPSVSGEGPDTPQPTFEGWSITGSISGSGINWDGDIDMAASGAFWVARDVKLASSDQFKFRKAHDWAENIGATGETEPAVVEIGAKIAGAANGKNLAVPADGTYDLYLNPDEPGFYVMTAGEVPAEIASWGVVGTINNWGGSADLAMVEENGMLVRKNVALTTGDQFKIRYMSNWDVNRGAPGDVEPFVMGTDAIAATPNGKNLGVSADGNYDVWYDALNEILFVVPAGSALSYWGVVGNITGWGGDRADYIMYKSGDFYAVKGIELKEDSQFKIRYSSGWDVNRGAPGDVEPFKVDAGSVVEATPNGKNLGVNVAGKYDIYYNAAEEKLYVMGEGNDPSGAVTPEPPTPEKPTAWSIVGTIEGSSWGKDFDLTNTEGDIWKYEGLTVTDTDEFKIRANHDWGTSVGGPEENEDSGIDPAGNPYKVFRPTIGTAFATGGLNIRIAVAGTYNVTFDYAAKTILIEGGAPAAQATIADFAKEYVKILDVWENTTGTIDMLKGENYSGGEWNVTGAHYVPDATTITVGDKSYNTADMFETALRSYLLVRGYNGLETEKYGKGSIPALDGGAQAMSTTDVPETHGYYWGQSPYNETPGNGGHFVMGTKDNNEHCKIMLDALDNWAMRSLNYQHGQAITNLCGYSGGQLSGYYGCFCSKRALLTYAFFFKYMLENQLDKADAIPAETIFRTELFGDEGAPAGGNADAFKAWLADPTKDYTLDGDITLDSFTPAAEMTGNLDGNGKTITVKNAATPVILVAKGDVKNITFAGSFAATPGAEKIVLAPIGKSYGTLDGVINKASVSLNGPAGLGATDDTAGAIAAGVVGEAYGPVKNCSNEGKIVADAAGKDTWTIIASGVIGVAGAAVEKCNNSGEVSLMAGSPLGRTKGLTEVSMKYHPVCSAAGIVTYAVSDADHTVTVTDCENTGKISFTYDNLNDQSSAV
ncbi:MAG: SusE domain-containing protein, partial [Victivallales bacterium]|nr:SusE domain-containing protein [Victivallales bacterium]